MQEEYTENLEKLFLSGKKTSAQNFFCVEKFGSKERKALNFFLKHEYLYGSNEGGKKCYLMGKAGFLFLQGNFYRWEYLQQKLTEKQKQFEIKIFPFLEKMFFFDKKIEIKELFAKEKITMKHISFWKDALDDDYISIETENNKKKYILTKKSLDLLQEDNENYKKLLKDKALQKKKRWEFFLKHIHSLAGKKVLTVKIYQEFSKEISYAKQENLIIEHTPNRPVLTEKGKQFLLTLQPAEKIIENLKKHFFKLEAEIANTQKMLKQLNDQKITINYELGEEFNDVSSHFHASMSLLNGIDNKIKERDIAEKWKEKIYLEIRDLKNEFELEKEDVKSKWSEQQKTNALTHAKKIKETQIKIKTQEENTSEQLKNLKSMLSEITNILHENKAMEGNFYTESDSKNEHKNINWETEREIYSDNKDVAESKLLNQIKKENNNKKTHIFNSNQKLADHLKVQEEVKIFETIEIEKALENNFNLEKNEIYNDEIFEDVNIEEEFSIEENKDENKHLSQEILQEIKKYYQLTYFQHRGSLKLGFLMDYLGEEFSTDREDIKEKIRNLFRQKELELHPLEKLDNVDINNIICDGNISYHALTI